MKKIIYFAVMFLFVVISAVHADSKNDRIKALEAELDSLKSIPEEDENGYIVLPNSPMADLALETGTDEIRAYAVAESASEMLAMDVAYLHAASAIQQKIESYVRTGIKKYSNSVTSNFQYNIDERTQEQLMLACKGIIKGVNILASRKLYNKNTRMYKYEICAKYDRDLILNIIEQNDSRIRANEKQFESDMQEAWNTLDDEHKKNRTQPEVKI